jgi:hypothetical protein
MMHKLRAMLCRVFNVAAKLAFNLPRPLMFPSLFPLVPIAAIAPDVLVDRAPTVSTIRLGKVLVIIATRVTSPISSSSSIPMRRGATTIKSSKGTLCSICRWRVWAAMV